jgi:hypothetical protein
MMVWEQQARRDRAYLKRVLEARGAEGLQQEVLTSLARQGDRRRLDVKVAGSSRSTNFDAGQRYQLTFLRFSGAPVEATSGVAMMSGREARAPELEVKNLSGRAVRHLEMGWIVKDTDGREFVAGSVPADLKLAPGASGQVGANRVLRFSRPLMVESMSGYVSHVEFDDGEVWIPSREDLADQDLDRLTAPSPEEQRLTNLYRRNGLQALIEDLDKF